MDSTPVEALRIERVGLGAELIDYRAAWELQHEVHADVAAGRRPPTVLLMEHSATFTAGRRTADRDRPADGSEVIEVDRGGQITWHGPGQLVCYPIVPLPQPFDVVAHVRRLEEATIRTCLDYGIPGVRVSGRSGTWCAATDGRPERKISAVGVRVAKSITMHGLALNVNCDLTWASTIVPCGISDAGVTSMAVELERDLTVLEVADAFEVHLRTVIEPALGSGTA